MAIASTQKWRDEVVKQFRYQGRVRMVMEIVSDVSKASVQASAENYLPITDVNVTLDNESPTYNEIATMEGIWRADGTSYLPSRVPSENLELPLMSQGFVTEETPLILDYSWGQPTSFIGLTFAWDKLHDSWPSRLTVYGYDTNGVVQYATVVTDIDRSQKVIDVPMDNVVAVRVVITGWSNPQLRARVAEMYLGVILEFNEKDVCSIEETTKQQFMCSSLPTDTQKYAIRNQIYRVTRVEGGFATANKSHPMTSISRIFNSTSATQGIATVETRYWKADGELFLPSRVTEENPDIPWMSADANFSDTDPIEIVITYENPVQLNTVTIVWDNIVGSWPTDATIEGKDSANSTVFSRNISATSATTQLTDLFSTVKTISIFIRKWSQQGQRARIGQFEALLAYGNNSIPSEVNNLFDPTLEVGYSKYLARRQKITVQYGLDTYDSGTLWLPKQVRFLDAWDVPTDALQVNFQASTRLAFLTQTYRKGVYSAAGVSFKSLALSILENSNVIKDRVDTEPWVLDSCLDTLYTNAPLPELAENALLQLIAGATGCTLGTNPTDGYVTISPVVPEAPYVINGSVQQQVPGVKLDTPLRSIAVKLYTYTVEDAVSELFNGSLTLSGTKRVTIAYGDNVCATNCEAEVSGATVAFKVFYGSTAVLDLVAGDTPTEVTVKLTGNKVQTSNVQITTFMDAEVDSGRDIVIDNKLITNMDTLRVVSARAYDFYSRRNTVSTKYLGFPDLKAGDACALYSQYLNADGYITEHTFTFNGGFTGNVKMLMEVSDGLVST